MQNIRAQLEDEWEQLLAKVRASKLYHDAENQYHALSDRDRGIVNVVAVLLAIFLLWQLLVGPALGYLLDARNDYQRQLEDHEWMVANTEIARQRIASGDAAREGSLLSIASSTAKEFDLSFNRFEPIGDDRVRLWMERVQFNSVVSWLGKLEAEHGISAIDISLDSSAPGYVGVRLTLQG